MTNYLKIGMMLLLLTLVGFAIHYFLLQSLGLSAQWERSDYTLLGMYSFAAIGSLLVFVLMVLTKFSMPDRIAFVFLGAFMVKAVANYLYIKEGLGSFENKFLELNFLAVFFLFLFFDVFVAYVIVNQDEKTVEN